MNDKLRKVQKAYCAFVQPFQGEIVKGDLEKSLRLAKKLYQATIELYEDKPACLEAKRYLYDTTPEPNYLDNICRVYGINSGLCGLYIDHNRIRVALYHRFKKVLNTLVSTSSYYKGDKGPFCKTTRKKIIHSLELRVELIDKLLNSLEDSK